MMPNSMQLAALRAAADTGRWRREVKQVVTILFVFVVGCAAAPQARPPFPAPDLGKLSPTELFGYRIYQLDQAAWVATDAALKSGLSATPIQGWLAVPSGSSFLVRFIGPCGSASCSYIDVQLAEQALPPKVVRLEPPVALPEEHAAMWRARQLAVASKFRACTPKYNTVVVPTEQDGAVAWRVYLLAASEDPEEVVLAGHHRITVTSDGRSIISSEALSKSCIVSKPELNQDLAGLFITHVLNPEPIETHVFTSLNYRVPLFVGTKRGTFQVEGASIRLVDPR